MTDEIRKALADECWRDLIEKDDRNSPEEYPEMALISKEELAEYLACSQPGTLAREEVARMIALAISDGEWIGRHDLEPHITNDIRAKALKERTDAILTLTPSHEAGTQEPVGWQWRAFIAGHWGAWMFTEDVEKLKNGDWAFNFENGTAQARALYAAPQPASVAHESIDTLHHKAGDSCL